MALVGFIARVEPATALLRELALISITRADHKDGRDLEALGTMET